MSIFSEIVSEILNEGVDVKSVNDAIGNTYEVIINYKGEKGTNTGKREIQPVAYGTTKAGFPAIKAFQPNGDTSSRIPSWKLFRLDRIQSWEPHPENVFDEPPGFEQQGFGRFNQNGDDSMSEVFKIASFGTNHPIGGDDKTTNCPVMKQEVIGGIQNEPQNTVTIPNSTRPVQKQYTNGPVTKQDVKAVNGEEEPEENGIDRLRNKLANQDYVSQAIKDAEYDDNEEEIENNG